MFMRYAANHPRQHRRQRPIMRRLVTDVLPTLVLLIVMALGMSLVARYAESAHFKPFDRSNQSFLQFSE